MPLLDSTNNHSKMCDHSLHATAYLQEQNILHKRVLFDFLLWISAIILSNNIIQMSIYSSFHFPCLSLFGFLSLLNIWGHIATVPACSSGTLTNVLRNRNAMLQTQDMTPQPVTVYRHRVDLLLSYTLSIIVLFPWLELARFCELKQLDGAHAKTIIHYYSFIIIEIIQKLPV